MQLLDAIQLTAPAPESVRGVTAQTVGVPGIRQYFYWIVTHYPIGATVGGPFPVRNAPSILSAADYVLVTGEASLGAVSYDVLRTDTAQFPSAPGDFALAIGLSQPFWQDQGAAPVAYDPTGLPYGAPVRCRIYLNNRDYAQPTLELPCAMKVSTIIFPDGSEQNTAAAGGSQTPWLSDIDAAGHQLLNLGGQLIVNGGIDAGAESFFNTVNVSNSLYVESASAAYALNVTGDVNITGTYRVNGVPIPQFITVLLSSADILALSTTSKPIVPAPGPNRVIGPLNMVFEMHQTATPYTGGTSLILSFEPSNRAAMQSSIPANLLTTAGPAIANWQTIVYNTLQPPVNEGLQLTTGAAFMDGTGYAYVHVYYWVWDIGA